MQVKHILSKKSVEKECTPNGFLLMNKIGGYCYFGNPTTRYNGMHAYLDDMYKIVSDFFFDEPVVGITNRFWEVERKRENFSEHFFYPHGKNVLVYETDKDVTVNIRFDIKKSFDNKQFGRFYSITEENGFIIVKYLKASDEKEDNSSGRKQYEVYAVFDCKNYAEIKEWVEEIYNLDKERDSFPNQRHVFEAFSCSSKQIIISVDKDKQKAIDELNYVKHNLQILKDMQKKKYKLIKKNNLEESFAFSAAKYSLDGLNVIAENNKGIFAGLPWFFQYWTRDEAISNPDKDILLKQISNILPDGRISNIRLHHYPGAPNSSADGVGWSFFRLIKHRLGSDKEFVKVQLAKAIEGLNHNHTKNGFAHNEKLETWMDTGKKDVRSGCRIEIQALRLAMYKFMFKLSKDSKFENMEKNLLEKVRTKFFDGKRLADGLGDWTSRPNIFIAAYVYPNLLEKKNWQKVFDYALPKLWLKWGGLSTIDKSHELFIDTYSGEKPISYHRGDSWFWINNLAAVVLKQTNSEKYSEEIEKITQASTKEILWQGMIGHHAELSSACKLKSEASMCQAWSNEMFLELFD